MAYPFLYSVATSVLQKLDNCNLDEFGNPNDMQKDVEMLKCILNHLPFILETNIVINLPRKRKKVDDDKSAIVLDIQKSVFGLHDLLNKQTDPSSNLSWIDLVQSLTKFKDHMPPHSSKKEEKLLSFISFSIPEIESQDIETNELPPHLVPCLAYCALYPEGNRIMRETVVNQWMAEGFLELQTSGSSSAGSGELELELELEDLGNFYFMELLSMGVFVKPMFGFRGSTSTNTSTSISNQQAVAVHSCEIHPQMHNLARRITHNEVWVIDSFKTSKTSTSKSKPLKIGSMIKDDSPVSHFDVMLAQKRRATRTMYIALYREPEGQEWQSFYLQRTCMFFVTGIKGDVVERAASSLSKLQILDLSGTQFKELPASLRQNGRLRYLAVSRNDHLKTLDNLHWRFLQTLAVDGCVQLEKVNLGHTNHLRHLYYTSKETTLEVHTSNLRILQLTYCSEFRSFWLSNSANFACLKRLRIFKCPRLLSLPDSIDLLPRVEELVFHNCAHLDLNHGRSMDSLPSLHYMEVIGLPKLTQLPAGLQSARALHFLMIGDCKSLRSIDHVLQHLVTLQKLCVYDCATLSISPNAFQSLTALQSLDIRKCPNIKITSTSDAGIHKEPFISHIPEVFLDRQKLLDQSDDRARGPQVTSFGAQTDSLTPTNFPHFILSFETFEKINSSQEMLDQEYKLKMSSKWKVLAQALNAIVNCRILQQQKLYCFLFPSDYEFERDTLFQLWMARGFFPEPCKHLFKRLLVQDCIRRSRKDISTGISMYTINVGKVTGLSNSFKSKDHYTLIEDEDPKADGFMGWNHVSVASKSIGKTMFETLEKFSELRTLLLVRDYGSSLKQIPPKFFKALHSMQVLDLSGCHISELPSTIKYMTQLLFLDLSFTFIERIPESIQFLQELQTLKLKGCKHLHKLPTGMKKLVNLYHLDFDVLGQLTSMPEGLGALTKLRTLSAFIVSEEEGCRVGELKGMNNLCGSLCISGLEYAIDGDVKEAAMQDKKHLTQLHLKWNYSKCYEDKDRDQAFSFLFKLEVPPSLAELQISNYPGQYPREWLEGLKDIVSITFLNCRFEKVTNLEWLQNLMHLNIYCVNGATFIESWDGRYIVSFPKLKTLTIDGMDNLENWSGCTELNIFKGFPVLSKISMKNCPKLPGLPFLSRLPSLTYLEISDCESFQSLPKRKLPASLKTLIIENCPSLKMTCSKGGDDWEKIKHVKDIWIDMKHIRSSEEDKEDESGSSDDESEILW